MHRPDGRERQYRARRRLVPRVLPRCGTFQAKARTRGPGLSLRRNGYVAGKARVKQFQLYGGNRRCFPSGCGSALSRAGMLCPVECCPCGKLLVVHRIGRNASCGALVSSLSGRLLRISRFANIPPECPICQRQTCSSRQRSPCPNFCSDEIPQKSASVRFSCCQPCGRRKPAPSAIQ